MSADPVVIAARTRARQAVLARVLTTTAPIAVGGIPLLMLLAAFDAPLVLQYVIGVPVLVAFAVTLLAVIALWVVGVRDVRNWFRPGSARAYDERRIDPHDEP